MGGKEKKHSRKGGGWKGKVTLCFLSFLLAWVTPSRLFSPVRLLHINAKGSIHGVFHVVNVHFPLQYTFLCARPFLAFTSALVTPRQESGYEFAETGNPLKSAKANGLDEERRKSNDFLLDRGEGKKREHTSGSGTLRGHAVTG